jgi:hypothetical protein
MDNLEVMPVILCSFEAPEVVTIAGRQTTIRRSLARVERWSALAR